MKYSFNPVLVLCLKLFILVINKNVSIDEFLFPFVLFPLTTPLISYITISLQVSLLPLVPLDLLTTFSRGVRAMCGGEGVSLRERMVM